MLKPNINKRWMITIPAFVCLFILFMLNQSSGNFVSAVVRTDVQMPTGNTSGQPSITDSEGNACSSSADDGVPDGETSYTGAGQPSPANETEPADADDKISYQSLYPELYCNKSDETTPVNKTVYLTFDDGPSSQTIKILSILKSENSKATFFTVGKSDEESKNIMKQIVGEGHTIAVHSYSHNYKTIYRSVEAFLSDFNAQYTLIYETTGVKPDIYRFPGGSINDYDQAVYKEIIREMNRRGFTYYDWNVSAADAAAHVSETSIFHNVIDEVSKHTMPIVLFHDSNTKEQTVHTLDKIIQELQTRGYVMDKLSNSVKPVVFKMK